MHPHNPISIQRNDAERLGIAPGAVAIEYGYGHRQLGAVAHHIDGRPTAHNPQHGSGVNLNRLGFADPTRSAKDNVWIDWASGAVVRQGLPIKVRKLRRARRGDF